MAKAKFARFKGIKTDVEWVKTDTLLPYENNPKKHPPEQIDAIADSIDQFGWDQPIVVDKNYVIVKGEGRWRAAKALGLQEVPVVIRTDLSPDEARASRIADNQSAQCYWNISNLIQELEALSGADYKPIFTGFSDSELNQLLPGAVPTEADEVALEAENKPIIWFIDNPSGVIGKPLDRQPKSIMSFLRKADTVIVPFLGDKESLAALIWCKQNKIPKSKVHAIDYSAGLRMWHTHEDYKKYVGETLGYPIEMARNKVDWFLASIENEGYPLRQNPKLFDELILTAIEEVEGPNKVVVWGWHFGDSSPLSADVFLHPSSAIASVVPLAHMQADAFVSFLTDAHVLLNPIYSYLDQYLIPGHPYYTRADFAFLREYDPDLWIRWLITIGRARMAPNYIELGHLNTVLLNFIAEGIDPHEYGELRELASEPPDPVQPVHRTVRAGDYDDNNPDEASPILTKEPPAWWRDVDYSEGFKELMEETERVKKAKEESGLDEKAWLKEAVRRAMEEERKNPSRSLKDVKKS